MKPVLIEPRVHADSRGFFFESWNKAQFHELTGADVEFVQDNHSRSAKNVLRGLHYQLPPAAQGKLVRVARGAVFDVAVDVRRGSDGFGRWEGHILSEDNFRQLWIPPGFAHGFLTLSETADVLYKATSFYAPDLEASIRWDDPEISIDWPLEGASPVVSPKDESAPSLSEAIPFPS